MRRTQGSAPISLRYCGGINNPLPASFSSVMEGTDGDFRYSLVYTGLSLVRLGKPSAPPLLYDAAHQSTPTGAER
jgi:hypothetical protein